MVVGADRVVANGDTANKIGTYQLAIVAKHHGIPFYVAAPSSSCDLRLETGKEIVIEERPSQEVTDLNGIRIAAQGKVWVWRSVLWASVVGSALLVQAPQQDSDGGG